MDQAQDPDPRIRLLSNIPIAVYVSAAIAAHVAATDPHGDRSYSDTQLAAHVAAADPHTQYQRESERNAAGGYAGLDGSSKLTGSQQVYGTAANTACQGNDSRLSDSRVPTGSAGGDLTGTFPNPTVTAGAITLAKMANLAANSILGNNTGSPATPLALTTTQVKALLAITASDVSGLATVATSGSASDLGTGTLPTGRMPAHTGDVTTSAGTVATTIAAGAVTLAKMANLAANSLIGNNTGSPATPLALTTSQVKTLLAISTSDVSGLGTIATQAASAVALTGGSINGTTVGATTPSTGAFTTITASGNVTVNGTRLTANGGELYCKGGTTSYFEMNRTSATGYCAMFLLDSTNTKFNWLMGVQFNQDNGFEITPSDAAGSGSYSTPALKIYASSGITHIKSLRLGNSFVAGAPAATGYVTITDNAGSTYKVLVAP